jgi:hypothetical protein
VAIPGFIVDGSSAAHSVKPAVSGRIPETWSISLIFPSQNNLLKSAKSHQSQHPNAVYHPALTSQHEMNALEPERFTDRRNFTDALRQHLVDRIAVSLIEIP